MADSVIFLLFFLSLRLFIYLFIFFFRVINILGEVVLILINDFV